MIMSPPDDFYRLLHVQPDAPTAVIRASYLTLHERFTSAGDPDGAKLLEDAYAVLANPERRAVYDLQRDIAASQRLRVPHFDSAEALERTGHFGASRCIFCGMVHGLQRRLDRDDACTQCRSPLYPAERHRLEYSGQRMLQRTPKRRPVLYYVGWPQAEPFVGDMRDLSLNGLRFAAPSAIVVNQVIKIDCDVCQALARVAHCEGDATSPEHWTIGAEFLTLRFRTIRGTFVSARA